MNKHKIAMLKDALEEIGDIAVAVEELEQEISDLHEKVQKLERENNRLWNVILDYGIDPDENRMWFIDSVFKFIQSLGI